MAYEYQLAYFSFGKKQGGDLSRSASSTTSLAARNSFRSVPPESSSVGVPGNA